MDELEDMLSDMAANLKHLSDTVYWLQRSLTNRANWPEHSGFSASGPETELETSGHTLSHPEEKPDRPALRPRPPEPAAVPAPSIAIFTDDPFTESTASQNPSVAAPIQVPIPTNLQSQLQFQINTPAPPPRPYPVGSAQSRHWIAEEAVSRAVNFWGPLLPSGTVWSTLTQPLQVTLDSGVDLNAFYARNAGLKFFHDSVAGKVFFSSESPDVVCHETGHAILDAIRPQLFNAASLEAAAIHEAMGDISAILSALQLPQLRTLVLQETGGRINNNSRLSRLAEQLGWAIRQAHPQSVDPDCLRNACNRFFYRPPSQLPPSAPANQLSSEAHSFSRVFSGAILDILASMYQTLGSSGSEQLLQTSRQLGQLIVDGFQTAPITSAYYGQVAAAMIQADQVRYSGQFRAALTTGFMRHGILSVPTVGSIDDMPLPKLIPSPFVGVADTGAMGMVLSRTAPSPPQQLSFERDDIGYRLSGLQTPELPTKSVSTRFGLKLLCHAPEEGEQFEALSASVAGGSADATDPKDDARSFVEDLVQQGRVDMRAAQAVIPAQIAMAAFPTDARQVDSRITHTLVGDSSGRFVLKRLHFDCGLSCSCG